MVKRSKNHQKSCCKHVEEGNASAPYVK